MSETQNFENVITTAVHCSWRPQVQRRHCTYLLNKVHREGEGGRKEKYGGKSRRMERDILKNEETTESKKHIGEKGVQLRKRKLRMNKTLEPGKDLV
jgi:hypothetical protein